MDRIQESTLHTELSEQDTSLFREDPFAVPIHHLCDSNVKFLIPAYQRGYKWEKNEVENLIEDIFFYSESKDGSFYCLQPIVVRHDSNTGQWRVIDGQQRLTTIYILLRLLNEPNIFELKYERETKLDCIEGKDIKIDSSTSESYHISQAYTIINGWLGPDGDSRKNKIKKIKDNLLNHARFIWYRLNPTGTEKDIIAAEHNYFMNLNSGKIKLTEAELIKALLLHNVDKQNNNRYRDLQQSFMAEEWDRMEQTLRRPEVWYFIAGRKKIPGNAMDYILSLLWEALPQKEQVPYTDVDYKIFAWAEKQPANEIWCRIVNSFRAIMGWFENIETYNLIGYFASGRGTQSYIPEILADCIGLTEHKEDNGVQKTHGGMIATLWRKALTSGNLIWSSEEIKALESGQPMNFSRIEEYHYKRHYSQIFNLLLLANISQNTLEGTMQRFDFAAFNDNEWNVEHISPANPKSNKKLLERLEKIREEWKATGEAHTLPHEVDKLCELIYKIPDEDNESLDNLTSLSDDDRKELEILKSRLLPHDEDDTMMLKNMSLLTERCNKGIGNKFFFDKKLHLRKYQSQGAYIPILTLHVFTKWYSEHDTFPLFWSDDDRNDYLDALENCYRNIFNKRIKSDKSQEKENI